MLKIKEEPLLNMRRWRPVWEADTVIALLTLLLITGAALYGVVTGQTLYGAVPDPVPPTAAPTEFSSGRALEHIRIIAQKPHPMGSPRKRSGARLPH